MKSVEPRERKGEPDEGFLNRWSRLKQDAVQPPVIEEELELPAESEAPPPLTDADMPPLESLDENSDYSGFLSPEVTENLRQQALQKLFRSACFNVCDGLDDYAEDFTSFEKLGDMMTADLKFRLEQEAKRMAEKEKAAPDREEVDTSTADQQFAQTPENADIADEAPLPKRASTEVQDDQERSS